VVPEAGTEGDAGPWDLASGSGGQSGCACSLPGVGSAATDFGAVFGAGGALLALGSRRRRK
jgi:MYXO-CTERM domain-containing protein